MTDKKPLFEIDVSCPACGSIVGVQCRRQPRGLSYTVSMPRPCFARSAKLRRVRGDRKKGAATAPINWRS